MVTRTNLINRKRIRRENAIPQLKATLDRQEKAGSNSDNAKKALEITKSRIGDFK
jgi:hypothetical protein